MEAEMNLGDVGQIVAIVLGIISLALAIFLGVAKGVRDAYKDALDTVGQWEKKYGVFVEESSMAHETFKKAIEELSKTDVCHEERMDKQDKRLDCFENKIQKLLHSIDKKLNGVKEELE
jgi:uncharacterized coiled-coil protein SlyX